MEEFAALMKQMILEKGPVDWIPGLPLIIGVYILGYLCGSLPTLLNRRKRKVMEQSEALRERILEGLCEYNILYNQYVRESDSSRRTLIGGQINALKGELKQLESRLAALEQRLPRTLPIRPLPVRQIEIR